MPNLILDTGMHKGYKMAMKHEGSNDTLVIRNFPSGLKMRLKVAALQAGVPLNKFVAEALEEALPEVVSGERNSGVQGVRKGKAVREDVGRKPEAGGVSVPKAGICVNCEHPKQKHGGFKGACQADNCLCVGFE